MSEFPPTPMPWAVFTENRETVWNRGLTIFSEKTGTRVADTSLIDTAAEANAELIVRAVNAHGPLVEALTLAYRELNDVRARDGVPRLYDGTKAGVSETYFSAVVDQCWAALQTAGVVDEQLQDISHAVKLAAGRSVQRFMPEDIREDSE